MSKENHHTGKYLSKKQLYVKALIGDSPWRNMYIIYIYAIIKTSKLYRFILNKRYMPLTGPSPDPLPIPLLSPKVTNTGHLPLLTNGSHTCLYLGPYRPSKYVPQRRQLPCIWIFARPVLLQGAVSITLLSKHPSLEIVLDCLNDHLSDLREKEVKKFNTYLVIIDGVMTSQ